MSLPPGSAYSDIGMSNVFKYFNFFLYFCIIEQKYFCMFLKY
jgi:hypothetical protein